MSGIVFVIRIELNKTVSLSSWNSEFRFTSLFCVSNICMENLLNVINLKFYIIWVSSICATNLILLKFGDNFLKK